MSDREKVVNALEHCIDGCFDDCPYEYGGAVTLKYCHSDLMRDALELLKEQEWQIKNRDESIEKAQEEIKWLRGMLKEQGPTHVDTVYSDDFGNVLLCECGCMWVGAANSRMNYCPGCGKEVK